MSPSRHVTAAFFILILSLSIYANTLNNNFVYDDEGSILKNSLIKEIGNLPKLFKADYFAQSGEMSYRPGVTFTYFLDYAAFGLKPWGYHLTNILLHAVNGIMLYILLMLLIQRSPLYIKQSKNKRSIYNQPFLISILFATHPVLTEAVNAVSFREDLLVFFFYISALNIYLFLGSKRTKDHLFLIALYALSCVLYFMALLSKEMAVTLPLIVFGYEWVYTEKKDRKLHLILLNHYNIGYLAITLAYLYVRFVCFQNPIVTFMPNWSLTERLLTAPLLFMNDIKISAFPLHLIANYSISPVNSLSSFVIPLLVLASLLVTAIGIGEKEATFGALFFVMTLAPVCNIIPIPNPFAERYLYLPIVGYLIVIASALSANSRPAIQNLCIPMLVFVITGIYSLSVIIRNQDWMNNRSLWSDTVKKMPESALAHLNLGIVQFRQGRLEEAILEYKAASKLNPNDPRPCNNLAYIYDMQGRLDEAAQQFYNALRLSPGNPKYHFNLANVFSEQRRFDEAIEEYNIALKQSPAFIEGHYQLGMAYLQRGRKEKAIMEFKIALKLNPGFLPARQSLDFL